jgi:hypothetical protein
VILAATSLRPPLALGPQRIVRLASEATFTGIAVDTGCALSLLPEVGAEALRSGLQFGNLSVPLPEHPLSPGKRLPHLLALDDRDERLAALQLARRGLEQGHSLGVPLITVELGPVPLRAREPELRLRFARREMQEDEPGERQLRRALEERRARGGAILDASRAALEPLVALADRHGIQIAVSLAAGPWQAPSPREAMLLLREFAGAPLGLVLAPARRAALESLALGGPAERWSELQKAGRAVYLTDAVGLDVDLLPGLGEVDVDRYAMSSPLPVVVAGRADARFPEVVQAKSLAEDLRRKAAP